MSDIDKVIPLFLKHKTANGLVSLMLKNNSRLGGWADYKIMHDGNHFYAWYNCSIDDLSKVDRSFRFVKSEEVKRQELK